MDPGGYGLDLLRSCYKTEMRFWPGGPGRLIRWYFCKPNTKVLPFSTTFCSRNWSKQDSPWPEIGEIEGSPRVYDKGTPPGNSPTYQLYGLEGEWREGLAGDTPGVPVNPACEVLYAEPLPLGVEIGGDCLVYTEKWITPCCPLGQPPVMRLWLRPFADVNPDLPDESYPLILITLYNLMAWAVVARDHNYLFIHSCYAGPGFHLDYLVDGFTVGAWDQANAVNCTTGRVLYTGGVQLPPFDPDPFKFYLYDVWVTLEGAPRPW